MPKLLSGPRGPDAVEIGFTWYAERVQRTALDTEAKLLLCSHAFERWKGLTPEARARALTRG